MNQSRNFIRMTRLNQGREIRALQANGLGSYLFGRHGTRKCLWFEVLGVELLTIRTTVSIIASSGKGRPLKSGVRSWC